MVGPMSYDDSRWGSAPGDYGPAAGGLGQGPQRRPPNRVRPTGRLVLLLLVAAAGAGIGHALWPADGVPGAAGGAPSTAGPFGGSSGGFAQPPGYGSGSGLPGSNGTGSNGTGSNGTGSNGTGAPAEAASIAANVDPGIVDIDTTLGYQNAQAAGTGMVLTSTGEVLTNNHVIDGATGISVTDVGNGQTYHATVVGYDRTDDVAVLRLTGASGLRTISVGASTTVVVGQAVVGVGNAGGTGGTPSYAGGTVSAVGQSITASDSADGTSEQLTGLIATNAQIAPGDSGGPLVNERGQAIGMDTAASTGFRFGQTSAQGFAIPIDEAVRTERQITAGRSSAAVHIGATAMLGVQVSSADGGFRAGSAGSAGAVVAEVVDGGPAQAAGLTVGDTLTQLDGRSIGSSDDLTGVMTSLRPGASVSLGYLDPYGMSHTTTVHVTSGPPQ
jgi:S1-C subfamily serine protease